MAGRAVTATLGDMTESAEAHLASGEFASMSEVVREGLRALDREEAAWTAKLKSMVAEADADPRPPIPMEEAFAYVRAQAEARRRQAKCAMRSAFRSRQTRFERLGNVGRNRGG